MKTTYLTLDHWRYLQMNPQLARNERRTAGQQAEDYLRQGRLEDARRSSGQAFEIAHAILLSPVSESFSVQKISEDMLAYGALAIYLARHYRNNQQHSQAAQVMDAAHQQLRALMPLFATRPGICQLMQAILDSLSEGQQALFGPHHTPARLH